MQGLVEKNTTFKEFSEKTFFTRNLWLSSQIRDLDEKKKYPCGRAALTRGGGADVRVPPWPGPFLSPLSATPTNPVTYLSTQHYVR